MGIKKSAIILTCALFWVFQAFQYETTEDILPIPKGWPPTAYNFDGNPITPEGIALGRYLFYDPILSADSIISCSSCHLSYTAFTHVDHALSHGIKDRIGTRNSPTLINLAWSTSFMWDGAVNHLDMQALAPIEHPAEMDNDIATVVKKLQSKPIYLQRFKSAFGDSSITGERLLKALAQFELTLISSNSKYDRIKGGEQGYDFTDQENRGYQLFKQHCNHCHSEPLFTTGEFANNGLPMDTFLKDLGRMTITKKPSDRLKFKIPTLRNIEFSFPYMHDGRYKTLTEVLNHYQNGIVESNALDNSLKGGVPLTTNEKIDLHAFLFTLTDKAFLFNSNHAFPKS